MEDKAGRRFTAAIFLVMFGFFMAFNGILVSPEATGDFPSFYWAPKMAFEKSISPYDYKAVQNAADFKHQLIHPYYGPPMGLMLLSPLTVLPYEAARKTMVFLNAIFLAAFLFVFISGIIKAKASDTYTILAVLFVSLSSTVHVNIVLGQINIFILLMLTLGWFFLKENRHPAIVAIPFAAACMLKLYPFIPILFLIAARKHKVLLWYIIYMIAGVLASVALMPAEVWLGWLQRAFETLFFTRIDIYNTGSTNPGEFSIFAFTSRLFMPGTSFETPFPNKFMTLAAPFFIVFFIMAAVCIPLFVGSGRPGFQIDEDAGISAFFLIMYMLPPGDGEVQLVFILPVLLLFIYRTGLSRNRYLFAGAVIMSALIAFPLPVWNPVFAKWPISILISTKLFILFAVLFWLIKQLFSGLDLNAKIGVSEKM